MFTEERLNEILNILNIQGKIKVKDMSQKFKVTEDCIRKDLKQLEHAGKLKRTYGGAIQIRQSSQLHDISEREKVDISTKTEIAKKALDLIEDRETIFLDISTINILIAKAIVNTAKRVTVVTNMLEIANILSASNNNITVVLAAGVLNKSLNGFIGSATNDFIKKYKFDKSFIGSCGIDAFDRSITTFEIEDGITKATIIQSSKKTFLVMENKKFFADGNYKFAMIDDINSIITDEKPNEQIIDILENNEIELI
ncbi:DeoR family transcriptional regulator [Clostridium chromiireducens]|uniref:DeoR family transcriptional regulator n=1 Tax=Clostridium chromiireducens TaxID=225345 RepID=A0A964RL84_9CLOT|nr:DeoR/GlpR family DNA-binding transcription regulator [Clostridium chromiireducens]MVX63809.1 DeoR family transcriptional regulator [Clostridium chromiireducens]